MITWIIVIATLLLIVATSEVQLWCFTLNRHAWWSKCHPELDRRHFNYKSLFYISTFSALLSGLTLFAWISVVVMGCSCPLSGVFMVLLFTIAFGSKVILIGYLSLLSKLCRLNKYYYPFLTTKLCKYFKRLVK